MHPPGAERALQDEGMDTLKPNTPLAPPIVPCVWMDDQAQDAASFYTRVFPGGRITAVTHYPQVDDNPSGKPPGSVLTVEFEIAGRRFTALNGGRQFKPNPSISFFVWVDGPAAADRFFAALSEGGKELMQLDKYPWSERYGWVQDRFGVSWQVMAVQRKAPGPSEVTIAPCLMFADAQHGNAAPAIEIYTRIFPQSRVESLEKYGPQEGKAGTVKHGRFVIAGQEMVAMDAHGEHGFTFDEGLSLQVLCDDQAEIDRYWEALSEGGEKGPCGWLKDRFGLSWQIAPEAMIAWLTDPDLAARERVFTAMLAMKKLDVAVLRAAFDGQLVSQN